MTLAELVAIVEGYLLDEVAATNALVTDFINKAIRDAEVRPHNFKHMETSATYTTTDDTQLLNALPSLWKDKRSRPFLNRNDGTRGELDWTTENEAWRWYPLSTIPVAENGEPEQVLVTATEILVYPEPDEESDWGDGNYRVVVPYYAYSDELEDDADTNWWTLNAPWYVIYQATMEGLIRNREENRAGVYASMAEKQYQKVRVADARSRVSSRATLVPHRDAYARTRPPRRL